MTLLDAVIDLIEDAEKAGDWVLVEEEGEFYSLPAAYMTDASYTGSRNIITKIQSGNDFFGPAWVYNEDTVDRDAQWAIDTYGNDWTNE